MGYSIPVRDNSIPETQAKLHMLQIRYVELSALTTGPPLSILTCSSPV